MGQVSSSDLCQVSPGDLCQVSPGDLVQLFLIDSQVSLVAFLLHNPKIQPFANKYINTIIHVIVAKCIYKTSYLLKKSITFKPKNVERKILQHKKFTFGAFKRIFSYS